VREDDVEQLRRLRVAAVSGRLPRDLGVWAVEFVERALGGRRDQRNDLLRLAAGFVEGSLWRKARTIHVIMRELPDVEPASLPSDSPTRYVRAAALIDPRLPLSFRQVLRVLDVDD
jgi:hypothetical protein